MAIYVGNLSRQAKENDLNDLFSEFGEVKSIKIIKDNYSGESKGFAFVEMVEETAATKAINALNQAEYGTNNLVVNQAKPRSNSGDNRYGNNGGGFNRRNKF